MKIIEAKIEDFMGIELVEIDASGRPVIEVTGEHGAGKSSLIRSLCAILSPKKYTPDLPVRRGAKKSTVTLKLGEDLEASWIVKMVWDERGGSPKLDIRSKDGGKYNRNATIDDWLSDFSLDPLSIIHLSPKDRRGVFLSAFGVDFDALDLKRAELYKDRTDIGRLRDNAKERLKSAPLIEDGDLLPKHEVSVSGLIAKLKSATEQKSVNARLRAERERAEQAVETLREQLSKAQEGLAVAVRRCLDLQDPDIEGIHMALSEAEGTNKKIRQRAERHVLETEAYALVEQYDDLSLGIEKIDNEKQRLLETASIPIPGISIGDDDLLLDGVPMSQVNTAALVPLCVSIVAALKPELRIVVVRNGNDLDPEASEAFYGACREAGIEQIWIEKRSATRPDAVTIREGVYVESDDPAE